MAVWSTPISWPPGKKATAALLNQYVRDNMTYLYNALAPIGSVLPYSDSTYHIDGWNDCDGTSGTDDLRDKFIRGAGDTYTYGATGGAASLTIAAHTQHVITQSAAHASHVVTQANQHASGGNASNGAGWARVTDAGTHSGFAVDAHSASAHTGQALEAGNTSHAHSATSTIPPYIALRLIQMVGTGSYTTARTWITAEVPTAAIFNTEFRDNPNHVWSRSMRLNQIVIWANSIASIPVGYAHCNGSGGTVDTRDRFIVGSGTTYTYGATGGATSYVIGGHVNHTPTVPSAHADHVVTQPPAHDTDVTSGAGNNYAVLGGGNDPHTFSVNAHAAHSWTPGAHSAVSLATLPPYVALAFMRRNADLSLTTRTWVTSDLVTSVLATTNFRDNFLVLYQNAIPVGGIVHYRGTIASIPTQWQLCDGTNSTPDLRNNFPVGAGTSYAVGATGGTTSPSVADHSNHSAMSGHPNHTVSQPNHLFYSIGGGGGQVFREIAHSGAAVSDTHGHTDTITAHSAHGAVDTTPPFIAYPYIERMS